MNYKSFEEVWASVENRDSYWTQQTILEFTIELHRLMKQRGMSKKSLAETLGSSQAYITKIFRGNANFTAETMTKLARAVNGKLSIHITPKEEKVANWVRVIQGKREEKPRVWLNFPQEETILQSECGEVAIG